MSYELKVNPFTNTNVQEIRERYSNNPFKVGASRPLSPSANVDPLSSTGVVDYNVNYNAPKANKNLAYAGFYSTLYGQPNYTGQKLDIMGA